MSLLKHPSVKLLVKHISSCEAHQQDEDFANSSKQSLITWKCTLPQGSFKFAVIWIQGYILNVEQDGKSAVLNDGTGQIVVTACDKVTTLSEMKEGMYMMVIGTLLEGAEDTPMMKPFKLQNLSHVDHVQEFWHLEVVDQIHYLTSQEKLT